MSSAAVLPAPVGISSARCHWAEKTCFASRFCHGKGETPWMAAKKSSNSAGLRSALKAGAPNPAAGTCQIRESVLRQAARGPSPAHQNAARRADVDGARTSHPWENSSLDPATCSRQHDMRMDLHGQPSVCEFRSRLAPEDRCCGTPQQSAEPLPPGRYAPEIGLAEPASRWPMTLRSCTNARALEKRETEQPRVGLSSALWRKDGVLHTSPRPLLTGRTPLALEERQDVRCQPCLAAGQRRSQGDRPWRVPNRHWPKARLQCAASMSLCHRRYAPKPPRAGAAARTSSATCARIWQCAQKPTGRGVNRLHPQKRTSPRPPRTHFWDLRFALLTRACGNEPTCRLWDAHPRPARFQDFSSALDASFAARRSRHLRAATVLHCPALL